MVVRCARYARISLDKVGDEHAVANQLADQQRVADAKGLVIVRTDVGNDISALNGKYRSGYEAVMAAAARGEIDVILVFPTSRFWGNRGERAKGIEVLRKAGVSLIATKGPSLDMSTAYGRGMAGLLGEFDTMESEVKAERQQLAAFHRAQNGQSLLAAASCQALGSIPGVGLVLAGVYHVSLGHLVPGSAQAARTGRAPGLPSDPWADRMRGGSSDGAVHLPGCLHPRVAGGADQGAAGPHRGGQAGA